MDGTVGVTMMKMGMMDEIMVERVVEKKKKKGRGKERKWKSDQSEKSLGS